MFALAFCAIAFANAVNGQMVSPTNCFPPLVGAFAGTAYGQYTDGSNLYVIQNVQVKDFTGCDPLPTQVGGQTVFTMGTTLHGTFILNGAPQSFDAPAQMTVRYVKTGGGAPDVGDYFAEMLQLTVEGGTLPAGAIIRESPTLQSTGHVTVSLVSGSYHMDSFFDIFTELSVNGAVTWMPSSAPPSHVNLVPASTTIPTMGEWGLIILASLMVVTAGTILFRRGLMGA